MRGGLTRAAPLVQQFARPALDASMWIYLWDLVDEGYDRVLGRLKEYGLTSVSLATAYHTGRFLLPHNPRRKVRFLEDGVVYFTPTPRFYGRVKPKKDSLVGEGHGLDRLRSHADRAGMETRAWVVCCHNTRLGLQYPGIACQNAFGDRLYHNLCPSNEDVRTYLRGLAQDIGGRGVTTLELEALQFQGYSHGFHHERDGIPLTNAMRFLLGLCFCDACHRRSAHGGLDLARVQEFARTALDHYCADPDPAAARFREVDDLPPETFEPFQRWRESVVVSLVEELQEATHATGVRLRPMTTLHAAARWQAAVDPARVAGAAGGLLATAYVKDGPALREALLPLQEAVGTAEIILGFQVGLPESGGREEFLDRMKTAREMGMRAFNYYNYGLIPLRNLAWIGEVLSDEK